VEPMKCAYAWSPSVYEGFFFLAFINFFLVDGIYVLLRHEYVFNSWSLYFPLFFFTVIHLRVRF